MKNERYHLRDIQGGRTEVWRDSDGASMGSYGTRAAASSAATDFRRLAKGTMTIMSDRAERAAERRALGGC